jgi:hypothetical protein
MNKEAYIIQNAIETEMRVKQLFAKQLRGAADQAATRQLPGSLGPCTLVPEIAEKVARRLARVIHKAAAAGQPAEHHWEAAKNPRPQRAAMRPTNMREAARKLHSASRGSVLEFSTSQQSSIAGGSPTQ